MRTIHESHTEAGIETQKGANVLSDNHLFEQPTQFYVIATALSLIGADDSLNVKLAWGYVGLRVAHSLVHSLYNPIMKRFGLFALSSSVLAVLTARGALAFFG